MSDLEIKLIKKREFAELAGVSPAAVSRMSARLGGAVVGKKINLNHPNAQDYISQQAVRKTKIEMRLSKISAAGGSKANNTGSYDRYVPPEIPEEMPESLIPKELAGLTLEEIVKKYGSIPSFNSYLITQKNLEEFTAKYMKNQSTREALLDKKLLAKVVLDMIDLLFDRIVTDLPFSLSERVLSIALHEGDEAGFSIQKVYQERNSRILKSCKFDMIERLKSAQV